MLLDLLPLLDDDEQPQGGSYRPLPLFERRPRRLRATARLRVARAVAGRAHLVVGARGRFHAVGSIVGSHRVEMRARAQLSQIIGRRHDDEETTLAILLAIEGT